MLWPASLYRPWYGQTLYAAFGDLMLLRVRLSDGDIFYYLAR